jgi:hypothetical protein
MAQGQIFTNRLFSTSYSPPSSSLSPSLSLPLLSAIHVAATTRATTLLRTRTGCTCAPPVVSATSKPSLRLIVRGLSVLSSQSNSRFSVRNDSFNPLDSWFRGGWSPARARFSHMSALLVVELLRLVWMLSFSVFSHMLLIRTVGGEFGLWVCLGGVGRVLGRSLDAALSRASGGSQDMDARDEDVREGGEVADRDCMLLRRMASFSAFSRMCLRWASVRPGRVSLMSMRRTSVGKPWEQGVRIEKRLGRSHSKEKSL